MPMRPRPSELDLDLIDREPPATSRSVADSLGSSKNSRLEYKPISELMKIHGVGYKKAEELYKRHNSTVEQGEDAFSRLAGVPHPQSQGLLPERNGSPAAFPARPEDSLRIIENGLRAISRDGPERSSYKNLDVQMNRIEALNSALSKPAPSYVRGG